MLGGRSLSHPESNAQVPIQLTTDAWRCSVGAVGWKNAAVFLSSRHRKCCSYRRPGSGTVLSIFLGRHLSCMQGSASSAWWCSQVLPWQPAATSLLLNADVSFTQTRISRTPGCIEPSALAMSRGVLHPSVTGPGPTTTMEAVEGVCKCTSAVYKVGLPSCHPVSREVACWQCSTATPRLITHLVTFRPRPPSTDRGR
jgi:hypothetical protein